MADLDELRKLIANKSYLFTAHASSRAAERGIRSYEIEEAIVICRLVEDYPNHETSPRCLILGYTKNGRPLHIVVTYPPAIKVITIYQPNPDEWSDDFMIRKSHE